MSCRHANLMETYMLLNIIRDSLFSIDIIIDDFTAVSQRFTTE